MEQKNELINPLSLSADIKDEMVREARAASIGISLKHYEYILRQIGRRYED